MDNKRAEELFDNTETETARQYEYMTWCRQLIKEKEESLGRPLRIYSLVMGCQMNARDSEKLLGIAKTIGFEECDREEEADLVVYNTCTVRENANQKVYGRLGYLHNIKEHRNKDLIIALCGCMMQEEKTLATIKKSYRFVDIVFGTFNIFKFAEFLYRRLTENKMIVEIEKQHQTLVENLPVSRKYPFKSGVNIMYGCNNFCSYCIVPYVRGREVSRKPEDILAEIRALVADGVKEIMLLGQNVNSYGKGLEKPVTFAELLTMVEKIDGLKRIRFMSSHPRDLSDELLAVMSRSTKVCKHLHLAMQSGSTAVLKRMNRHHTKEDFLSLVEKVRSVDPDMAFTTDIIVGFPGETEEDVDDTIEVIRKAEFDGCYTFIYSPRTGTPAATFPDQIQEEVVKKRFDRVLAAVQEASHKRIKRLVGQTKEVLVEEVNGAREGYVTGRLDNNVSVHFPGDASLVGQFVMVKLIEEKGFYYLGEMTV